MFLFGDNFFIEKYASLEKCHKKMQPGYCMHYEALVPPLLLCSSEDTKIILSIIALVNLLITYFLEMSVSSWMSKNQPTKLLS